MTSPRGTYLRQTFLELGDGFHFSDVPPLDIVDSRHLDNGDPWVVLGCLLARAQRGDTRNLDRLIDVMRRNEGAGVWNACSQLLGFAARRHTLQQLASAFRSRHAERGVQLYVSTALVNSCELWVIPDLLTMYSAATDADCRNHLQLGLSRLLEPEPAELWVGPKEEEVVDPDLPPAFGGTNVERDLAGYIARVRMAAAAADATLADPATAVVGGRPLVARELVEKVLDRLGRGVSAEAIEWERMVIEALTGAPLRDFFGQRFELRPLAGAALLEALLDSRTLDLLRPGVRYFFGHPVEQ